MEFMGPSMGYYDPPNMHEVCVCWRCHDAGDHTDDTEYWANVEECGTCIEIFNSKELNT